MQKLIAMFNIFVGIFQRGGCTISKIRNTHKPAGTLQHATYHGDRGARGSSGSCSANGPRGCGILAKYSCSVRVCAMGQICRLTSRQNLEKKYLVPISDEIGTKHPFRWILRCWKLSEPTFASICRVHGSYSRRIL